MHFAAQEDQIDGKAVYQLTEGGKLSLFNTARKARVIAGTLSRAGHTTAAIFPFGTNVL
jgi:hypothetical protein